MAVRDEGLSAEIPEGDYAEQLTPADPVEEEARPEAAAGPDGLADEADWADQQEVVPLDEEGFAGAAGAAD